MSLALHCAACADSGQHLAYAHCGFCGVRRNDDGTCDACDRWFSGTAPFALDALIPLIEAIIARARKDMDLDDVECPSSDPQHPVSACGSGLIELLTDRVDSVGANVYDLAFVVLTAEYGRELAA